MSDKVEQGIELAQGDDPTAQEVFNAAIRMERELKLLPPTAESRIVQFWKEYGERLTGSPRIREARQALIGPRNSIPTRFRVRIGTSCV